MRGNTPIQMEPSLCQRNKGSSEEMASMFSLNPVEVRKNVCFVYILVLKFIAPDKLTLQLTWNNDPNNRYPTMYPICVCS